MDGGSIMKEEKQIKFRVKYVFGPYNIWTF